VVSLLLLVLDGKNTGWWEALLRVIMVLDLLGLMGAYAAGSCRDKFTTIYSALLVCAVFAYVVAAFCWYLGVLALPRKKHRDDHNTSKNNDTSAANVHGYEREELHEVLMLLATFAVTITYVAGLNPPGGVGFWGDTKDGHQMSDPVLQENYSLPEFGSLPSAIFFAECFISGTRQRAFCRVPRKKPSVKENTRRRSSLPSVFIFDTRQRVSVPSVFF
jgi:hypothetical protein